MKLIKESYWLLYNNHNIIVVVVGFIIQLFVFIVTNEKVALHLSCLGASSSSLNNSKTFRSKILDLCVFLNDTFMLTDLHICLHEHIVWKAWVKNTLCEQATQGDKVYE